MIEMFDMIVRNVSLTVTKIRIANVTRHEKPIDMQSSLDLEWCIFYLLFGCPTANYQAIIWEKATVARC